MRTGEPLNSGLRRIQLRSFVSACYNLLGNHIGLERGEGFVYLRKYCNPALRFSRNLGRNFEIMDFGGRGGMAARELGKVWRSLEWRSENSE